MIKTSLGAVALLSLAITVEAANLPGTSVSRQPASITNAGGNTVMASRSALPPALIAERQPSSDPKQM